MFSDPHQPCSNSCRPRAVGLDQQELARRVGVRRLAIQRIELEISKPRPGLWLAFGKSLCRGRRVFLSEAGLSSVRNPATRVRDLCRRPHSRSKGETRLPHGVCRAKEEGQRPTRLPIVRIKACLAASTPDRIDDLRVVAA